MTTPIASEPRTAALYHAAPDAKLAIKLAASGIGAILFIQLLLALTDAPIVVAIGGSYIAAIAVILMWRVPAFAIGLRPAPARFYVAGVLVGLASWYLRLRLVELFALPGGTQSLEAAATQPDLGSAIIAIALLPAIAEELIFRGVVARAIARRSQWLAIVLSAAIFAVYHIIPVQAVAVFPFGLAVAFIALRGNSIFPTILAHAINNIIGIVLARDLVGVDELATLVDAHGDAALAIASLVVAVGIALAVRPANYANLPKAALVRRTTNSQ